MTLFFFVVSNGQHLVDAPAIHIDDFEFPGFDDEVFDVRGANLSSGRAQSSRCTTIVTFCAPVLPFLVTPTAA